MNGLLVQTFCFIAILTLFHGCKTVDPFSVPQSDKKIAAADRAKIYSCSDVMQDVRPSAEKPLAGRYVVTAFGDEGTLTWMAKEGENEVFDADCRYDENIDVTTCETFGESVRQRNGDVAPIWAFTIDHAHEDDVRILGFNGTFAAFKATGKPMPLLGMIPKCPDETKR